MNVFFLKNKRAILLFSLTFFDALLFAIASEKKDADTTCTGQNRIEIKDFAFYPQTITVKSGEKITWVNRDEEPHTVVSVGQRFKKSSALDTDQEYTITAGRPGSYAYFCSVHPMMTGTIIVEK
jgi:plastocyanin